MVNKRLVAFSLILLSVLAIALLVNAEGSSTRTNGNNDSGNNDTNQTNQTTGMQRSCINNSDCFGGSECEGNVCVLDAEDEEENETDDDSDDDENETEDEDDCGWRCAKWSMCENGTASRTCQNVNNCTTEAPRLSKSCFERDKVCCKITETETEDNVTKTKTEFNYEDRTSCLEQDEEGQTKEIVAKGLCTVKIREECEYDGMKERIKCRLENHNRFENFSDSDESCEGLRNKGLCVALYVISQNCYKIEDGEKRDRCFKMVSEFREIHVGSEVNESENKTEARERVKHYMVLVLYNLQQKVEKAVNKSKLTSEQGASLIEKIVEIKQSILNGESKESIKSQIRELKNLWKTYKADEGENDE
ncbi:MAG TPA: hypothetical protein VJH92_02365 [Candidatus Nanoarchaeia archaeon]|nr:hypothetical protein [Candidatus Nanoarchaeia archaeon]